MPKQNTTELSPDQNVKTNDRPNVITNTFNTEGDWNTNLGIETNAAIDVNANLKNDVDLKLDTGLLGGIFAVCLIVFWLMVFLCYKYSDKISAGLIKLLKCLLYPFKCIYNLCKKKTTKKESMELN